jgi:hypothetical protein
MLEENRETHFKHLVREQNSIGWNHILKGQFSHKWVHCQQLHIHLDSGTDKTKQSGKIWLKRVLNQLWTSLWNVWLIRNGDLHGRDRQQREQKRHKKLIPKVEALYDQANTLLTADKEIFTILIHTQRAFPSGEIETWIKLVTPTVQRAIKDVNEFICRTNHTLLPHLVTQHDPLTRNQQVNKLRPVSRMHNAPTKTHTQT